MSVQEAMLSTRLTCLYDLTSSFIDVYFLYRSVMDLNAIKQAVLLMLKIGKLFNT